MSKNPTTNEVFASKLSLLVEEAYLGLCPVGKFAKRDPESGQILVRLLDETTIPVVQIYQIVFDEQIKIGKDTLYRHRNKRCVCFK